MSNRYYGNKDGWFEIDSNGRVLRGPVGPDRKWVDPTSTREKNSHPYSYSEFFIFGDRDIVRTKGVGADYSDRLREWNPVKYDEACQTIGKRFDQMSSKDASTFLNVYFGAPKTCVALAEGCNASSGYPYWIFWYKD